MVYDEIVGNIPKRVYVDWGNTPGQNIRGTVLNIESSDDPYPDTVKISVRKDDDTIATFYAPTDLKGKIHPEDAGKYVDITYLGPEENEKTKRVSKKFRVLREVAYQRPPKRNGAKK